MNTKTNRILKCCNCDALISAGELFCNTRFVIAIKDGRTHHLDEDLCRNCADYSFSGTDETEVTYWEHDILPITDHAQRTWFGEDPEGVIVVRKAPKGAN